MHKEGFTLIELLIVVAIIAILAAIAIPNFIEAQVRSKVSREKANMRSIATGLEAYRVDWPHYPPDRWNYLFWSGPPFNADQALFLSAVTTPVAYLTSIPDLVSSTAASSRRGSTETVSTSMRERKRKETSGACSRASTATGPGTRARCGA